MMKRLWSVACLSVLVVGLGLVAARSPGDQEPVPAQAPDDADAGAWHTVEPGRFVVEASLEGVFEAEVMHPVRIELEEWTRLRVAEAVEQGEHVSEGDTLVVFDTEGIDREIEDAALSHEVAAIALERARDELERLEETTPLDLAQAERDFERAEENVARFVEVERDATLESSEFNVYNARNMLAYQREELRQLEKMYRQDELTEETEEIILERQRHAVERAEYALRQAEIRHEETVEVRVPRREQDLARSLERASLGLAEARAQLPMRLRERRRSVEKMGHDHERTAQRLGRLRADRERMRVPAPAGGVVYYGRCERGRWPQAASVAGNMRPGGSFNNHATLVTIVEPDVMFLRAAAPEGELHKLSAGAEGWAEPVGFPGVRLGAAVRSVSPIAIDAGRHDVIVEVDGARAAERGVMPGMNARVKVIGYEADDTLTVPAAALHEDEPGRPYVLVRGEDGEAVERPVEVGRRSDGVVEIIGGLSAGDAVRLERADGEAEPAEPPDDADREPAGPDGPDEPTDGDDGEPIGAAEEEAE